MNAALFLDEFRPFRRGELALARKLVEDPVFLHPRSLDLLRYALRLAQLSSAGGERDDLVDRVGSFRLRLLQLLAPILPTDPARIDPARLEDRLPKVAELVAHARQKIVRGGVASEEALDAEIARKRLAVVLGGAAGSGYVFLGALQRLERMGIEPAYAVGCSVGSVLAVVRARRRDFDLAELFDDVQRLRERGVFRPPRGPRFGLPAALRLDLRGALGDLFADRAGRQRSLAEMAIPVDCLATGLGPGALTQPRESYSRLVDSDLRDAADLSRLGSGVLARVVGTSISLAMSRRVLVPLFLGSDPESAELPALDAAGFSAAIPALLSYEPPLEDERAAKILEAIRLRHGLVGIVDGALSSLIPARYAWDAIEAGRIGTRHCAILALDAIAKPSGANSVLAPLLRTISATADRDKPFWDLHVNFRRAPPFLDLFPTAERLRRAAENGEREFGAAADVLRGLLAPVPRWKELAPHAGPAR